jgi:hypothetical protein
MGEQDCSVVKQKQRRRYDGYVTLPAFLWPDLSERFSFVTETSENAVE